MFVELFTLHYLFPQKSLHLGVYQKSLHLGVYIPVPSRHVSLALPAGGGEPRLPPAAGPAALFREAAEDQHLHEDPQGAGEGEGRPLPRFSQPKHAGSKVGVNLTPSRTSSFPGQGWCLASFPGQGWCLASFPGQGWCLAPFPGQGWCLAPFPLS